MASNIFQLQVNMTTKFKGTGVALITPFDADGQVDYPALLSLLRHVDSVDYLVVLGTTGESATLAKEEKKEILSFVVKHNAGKLPLVYGLGGNDTRETLETIKQTDFTGVDAILSVSPYYNKPSQNGVFAHYERIADECPVPVFLYNVPGRTGINVTAQTTLRLARHPNVIGIKEANSDLTQSMEIMKGKPDDFLLISGDDILTVPMISLGGVGAISVLANAFPQPFSRMINHALVGEFGLASEYLHRFLAINPMMYEEANPVGVKMALHMAGICAPHVRLPLVTASSSLTERIRASIEMDHLFAIETAVTEKR